LVNGKGKGNSNALFKEMTACSFSSIFLTQDMAITRDAAGVLV
jgi:hypothetical protein